MDKKKRWCINIQNSSDREAQMWRKWRGDCQKCVLVLRNRGRLCVLNWITCFNLERPVQFPPSLFYTQTGPLTDDRFTTLDRHPHTQHDSCSHTLVALAPHTHTHTRMFYLICWMVCKEYVCGKAYWPRLCRALRQSTACPALSTARLVSHAVETATETWKKCE